jgi:hypothetical protein
MRWMTAVLLACLLVSTPAFAVVSSVLTHTFQSAAGATGNGTALDVSKYNSLSVQLVISNTATVTFEGTVDNSNWVSLACTSIASTSATLVTSATASGLYQCNTAGLSSVRMRISAWTSGTVTVTGVLTTAVASKKGGGAGGSTIATSEADGNPAVAATDTLIFPNSSLTDNGDGSVTIAFPSGNGVTVGDAVSGTANNGLLYSDASGNVAELDCANGEVATQAAGAWTCGTVDAANRALSNLASVALNTALLPDAAAADDFGSATLPFKDFFLAGSSGTPGTNNFKITGASTSGTRVITLPDATVTVAGYTGSPANNDCPKFNVAGGITTLVTSGAACGGSGTNNIVMTLGTGAATSLVGFTWADATTFNFGVSEILAAGSANEATVCVPVPVTSTLVKVYYHIRVNGALQSADGANTLKIRNQTTATDTAGITPTFSSATTTGNETPSLAFTAGDCVSGKLVTASPATDPTNIKMHATLLFTVP